MEIGGKISRRDAGFTLIELLISIAILSIIMLGLQQVLTTSISAYSDTRQKQDLLADARMAMERIVMYVQATDEIATTVRELLKSLVTIAPPKNREFEKVKAQDRAAKRFGRSDTITAAP